MTPPELAIPSDVTIDCSDSIDPSNTGQATATDAIDPSPAVTYIDGEGYATNGATTVHRMWTATDASGNATSGEQTIAIFAPSANVLGADPSHVTSLPQTVTVSFTVDGCATQAQVMLDDQDPSGASYSSGMQSIVANDVTVNAIDVTVPLGAVDSTYRLVLYLRNAQGVDFLKDERDFVTVGTSPEVPELTSVSISAPISYFVEYPREDELIQIEFTSTIPLSATPMVTVLGRPAVVSHVNNNTEWEAGILLLASDPEGIADFTIDFESLAGVAGSTVTETTDGSWVLYDRTPPSAPVLVEPADGATETPGSVYFLCEESTDTGSGIWRYHWYDSHGNDRTTSRSHAHEYATDDTFTWWMVAEDYAGNYSDPSPERTLTIYLSPELLVTETGGSTDVTEGEGDPPVDLVTVQFNKDPGADVDVIVTPDAQLDVGEGAGMPYTFHYVHGVDAWTRQFEIETGAFDDTVEENMHTGILLIETSCAGNPAFDGLSRSVTVNITDNDDFTPPVLIIPPDVTIACDDPSDPANTGQATATDNLDPSPVITYTESTGSGLDYFIWRSWTATDAAGNSSSATQEIRITSPGMTAIDVSQAWVGDLPTTVTIWFTLEKCATLAKGYLNGLAGLNSDFFSDDWVPAVSDGVTVNSVEVTLPADAPESEYHLVIRMYDAEYRHFDARGPFAFVTVDLTDPVLTVPGEALITLGDSTDPSNTGQATATDNYDPSPAITYTDSAILSTEHPEVGLIERTWRAEDAAGNFDEGIQSIRVDLTPPVAMAVVPAGGSGEEAILDLVLDLPEGEDPPMIGTLPLSAIYTIGDPITGSCTILNGAGDPLTNSRIFLYLYAVTIDGMIETRTEVASSVISCDRTTGEYCFHLESADLEPGIYDVYLGFEDGSSQILRIEVQAPPS